MSETVKLIIEISKEEYEFIKSSVLVPLKDSYSELIVNGTPFDDVKAEIEEQAYLGINDQYSQGLFEALRIIDKHIGKETVNESSSMEKEL